MEHLVFCKNLIFWNINLLISLVVSGSIFVILDNSFPFFIVHVHQVLNFEPRSNLKQLFVVSKLKDP